MAEAARMFCTQCERVALFRHDVIAAAMRDEPDFDLVRLARDMSGRREVEVKRIAHGASAGQLALSGGIVSPAHESLQLPVLGGEKTRSAT